MEILKFCLFNKPSLEFVIRLPTIQCIGEDHLKQRSKDKTPTITDEGLLFKQANDDAGLQYI
jgi:hypothetical protein